MTNQNYVTLCCIWLIGMLSVVSLSAEDLPKDSQELLEKLENFSIAELEKAQALIDEKQELVISILVSHMKREAEAERFDNVIALRKKIGMLSEGEVLESTLLLLPKLSETNVIAYYSFDGGDKFNAIDLSKNRQNGKIIGAEIGSNREFGKALKLGVGKSVDLPDFKIRREFTISLLLNLDSKQNGQSFVSKATEEGGNIFIFGIYNGGYHIRIRNATFESGDPTEGKQHLVVTGKTRGDATFVKFFKNSELIWEYELPAEIAPTKGKGWALGQEWDEHSRSDFVHGLIDEVVFLDKALDEQALDKLFKVYEYE